MLKPINQSEKNMGSRNLGESVKHVQDKLDNLRNNGSTIEVSTNEHFN